MDEYDPRRIVTLVAINLRAERAWNRSENRDRCEPASESDGEVVDIPSRGTTPAEPEEDESAASKGNHASRIHLTFDKKPKNLEKGFVFGSDPQKCDVVIGNYVAGFSRQHFRITFNARGEVILEDTSRKATCVNYRREKDYLRNHFTWILFDHYENIVVTLNKAKPEDDEDKTKVKVKNTNELIFKVEWPKNRNELYWAEYNAHRDAYLEDRRNALPSLSQLGVESQQTTAQLTAPHAPRQQPTYLLEEELGRGQFGTVHKVLDVSTGDEYAGKTFHGGGHWEKEVKILKSISHEHIVEFVNFSEEQNILVMEYLPLGNLACQDNITEEETLQMLCQGLEALDYLHSHSPPIAHRDIKPENILVQCRNPFAIKLVDFGLAKNGFSLKTFCGTNEYAAPEIWEHNHYTDMVDIWSLGVVVLQYGYGLPKPSRKAKGKPWCRDLAHAAEDLEGEGDRLIDLISTKMLRMDYQNRQSAKDCLEEAYAIQIVEIGRTTPTGETAGPDGLARTKSVIQNTLWGGVISSGFWNTGGTSDTTVVTPSKHVLRDRLHFYNPASPPSLGQHRQGPTQIWNPQTEDKATSTLSKRWGDALRSGQSKRSRASVSCEAGEQPFQASNPKHDIQDPTRAMVAGNRDGKNEGKAKVTDFDARHVQIKIRDKIVLMRKEDCFLNATQILTLTNKNPSDIEDLLRRMEEIIQVEVITPIGGIPFSYSWVNFENGQILCKHSGLEQELQPLIDYGRKLQRDDDSKPIEHVNNSPTKQPSQFFVVNVLPQPVTVRRSDFRIRAIDICRASSRPPGEVDKIKREFHGRFDLVYSSKYRGIYVDFWVGVGLCRRYGLTVLEKELRTWKGIPQEPELSEPEISEFIQITGFSSPIMVRKSDFRINASHIVKIAGLSRTTLTGLRKSLNREKYDIWLGSSKYQGTYVNFDTGIAICRNYGLSKLEERLCSLTRTSEAPVLEAEPSHVGPRRETVRRLSESLGIWSRDPPPTVSGGPITDGPMQAEDTHETDSGSDVAGSGGSVTSRESCSIQRKPQPEPSIRGAKDATSSRQSERDTRHSLLELAYPHSHSPKNVPSEIWDSQTQLSRLTEVNPDLKPSTWKSASPYGSLSDLFAQCEANFQVDGGYAINIHDPWSPPPLEVF